jgi:hypothetical protein
MVASMNDEWMLLWPVSRLYIAILLDGVRNPR